MPPGGLNIGGEPIRRVEGTRFLGVWVDEGIRWNGQIKYGPKLVDFWGWWAGQGQSWVDKFYPCCTTPWSYLTFSTALWLGGIFKVTEI